MPKNYCIMQIWAESGKSALPICNYSQILYQFLTFTQNLKRSLFYRECSFFRDCCCSRRASRSVPRMLSTLAHTVWSSLW